MGGDSGELDELKRKLSELQAAQSASLERLLLHHKRLEERVALIENTPSFRIFRSIGGYLESKYRKLRNLLHQSSSIPASIPDQYAIWLEEERLAAPPVESRRSIAQKWVVQPCVSILMPVENPRRELLLEAIESVRSQTYENWQLCICDGGSNPAWVSELVSELASRESRVRYVEALNLAREAKGDYVGFLDNEDVLRPHALHAIVEALQGGGADIIYSDEDYLDSDGRARPNLKPGWSPEIGFNSMYPGRFLVVSRGFRRECEGAWEHDLILRTTGHKPKVLHVPQILYRRRRQPEAALLQSAGRRADSHPTVSVIICTRNSVLLKRCLTTLREFTDYPNWEVVVVQHTLGGDPDLGQVSTAGKCVTASYSGQFNFSRMNNVGASLAGGEILIFLNDDVEPIRREWMTSMAGQVIREEVGVVGASLLYPSGLIQHAGLVVGMLDGAGHVGRGLTADACGLWPWLSLTRNVTAVTGACLGIRKSVFDRLGGMDPAFPNNYNDVDLCLRAAREGYTTVFESRAVLRHRECSTRVPGTSFDERELFHTRWADVLRAGDRYYSPMLRLDTEAVMLRGRPL